ncbi:TetR/AcrR family transcriptional regulator [Mycobacteroides abscessus]|nr:TetR/AcrR family transcriptional regulator [Mycobacteroides abscessus]MBL3734977.1 TetR/AcrR family transcriptional regulator [Mycobacteroides abscessus subsp. massiliense]MBL3745348.1 TetR/AcrR family transcriptional regulator [Mycobacteroides abscessus subsp. massiliense]MBL3758581.1 TetR/AcrR family transcriptional regulator [Mycobacteroides abscessus subsp. massiliense]MBN7482042.1 TetR/AcrR family transcriptional regulator [Mycobacteroides abscessus subsp. massiliense]MDM2106013.1 heli
MPTPRRTQGERSAAMRARLLEATIDCLVEFGYAGTTTSRIASRAGATRGALIHHFQSKSELMAESVRHLAFKRTQAVLEELMAMDQSVDPIERYLDVLWRIHQRPLFIAVVELLIAARTEPDLRVHLDQFEKMVLHNLSALNVLGDDDVGSPKERRDLGLLAMDIIRGLLVSSLTASQETRDRRWSRAKHMLELRLRAPSPEA